MKKLLLVPTLISAAALATPAFADSLLPTLSSETITQLTGGKPEGWSEDIGNPSSISVSAVEGNYASGYFSSTGWYWGLANLSSDFTTDVTITEGTGFTYAGRQNYGGEFVAAVVNLDDLLGDTGNLLTSFTISFDMESTGSEGFHIYCVNTTTSEAVEFTSAADLDSGSYSYTWEAASEDEYLSGDYALMFIWNGRSGGVSVSVSDLSSSYVTTPEPSMFGLFFGLGAIGLVATRRRRR